MIQMILVSLFGAFLQTAPANVAQFKPCVFPNPCGGKKVVEMTVAQFKPCVFPNPCGQKRSAEAV